MRNIINVHVGQAGVQIGHSVWEQLCQEHSIDSRGRITEGQQSEGVDTMFLETMDGHYRPRAVFVDA